MENVTLTISVKSKTSATPEEIAEIVGRLINIGLEDASAVVEAGYGDVEAATLATDIHICAPTVEKEPRVLVVVGSGVADTICDDGVDVEIFDWDNYGAGDLKGVPAHFADLAEPINVPVNRSQES